MRGWTIGPVAAVVIVLVVGACAYIVLARGGEESDEDLIRAYHREQGKSRALADEIDVGECRFSGDEYRSTPIFRCPLTFRGETLLDACYAIDDDAGKVRAGPQELTSVRGCRPIAPIP
jgi:hypothetical protein